MKSPNNALNPLTHKGLRLRHLFCCRYLVELNDPDENNWDRIIAYKHHEKTPFPSKAITTHSTAPVNKAATFISDEGETVVRQTRQFQKHLSKKEVAQIIRAYQNGKSANQLAEESDCDRHTIIAHLKKHGIEVSRSKIRSEEAVRNIIALYEDGHFIDEIAKQYDVSASAINRLLKANGVQIRSRWDYER